MGGFISGPKAPAPPPPPPPMPEKSDQEVRDEELKERRRRAAAKGRQSTILTGAQGVQDGVGGKKTLLGA